MCEYEMHVLYRDGHRLTAYFRWLEKTDVAEKQFLINNRHSRCRFPEQLRRFLDMSYMVCGVDQMDPGESGPAGGTGPRVTQRLLQGTYGTLAPPKYNLRMKNHPSPDKSPLTPSKEINESVCNMKRFNLDQTQNILAKPLPISA